MFLEEAVAFLNLIYCTSAHTQLCTVLSDSGFLKCSCICALICTDISVFIFLRSLTVLLYCGPYNKKHYSLATEPLAHGVVYKVLNLSQSKIFSRDSICVLTFSLLGLLFNKIEWAEQILAVSVCAICLVLHQSGCSERLL